MMDAEEIVQRMYDRDAFSQWLGIQCIELGKGLAVLQMKVRKEMLNGFNIAHGGITYSLADSCLAFAANTHGRQCLSLETSMSYIQPLIEGDTITATAKEVSLTLKIGIYQISIVNQHNESIALFKGTVYRTSKEWK